MKKIKKFLEVNDSNGITNEPSKKGKTTKDFNDIMLTLLDGGDLKVAERLNMQTGEYISELVEKVNELNILDLQEFVFGYMCGSKIINHK